LEQEYLPRYSSRFPWSKNFKGFLLQCYWREYFKLFSPRFSHYYWSKNYFYQSIHHIIVEERFLSDFHSGFHLIVIGVRVLSDFHSGFHLIVIGERVLRYFHHGFFWRENTCDILLFICIIYIIV
jgi:ubiquinone/menaquinone biosynthesis C-methylase UbiE